MLLPNIESVGSRGIQRAKSIEIGIIDPKKAAILVAENGCIAFDMNVCKPEVLRAVADLMEDKKPAAKKTTKKVK